MNPVIRAQLREFAANENLNTLTLDRQFEVYSIFCVLIGLLGEGINAYDCHLGGDEFGLDGVAVLIQGEAVQNRAEAEEKLGAIRNPNLEFIFFQSKSGSSFDYGDISRFFDAVKGFFDGDMNGESERLQDLIEARETVYEQGITRRNPKVSCYYCTTGNYERPSRIETLRRNFVENLKEMNIFDNESVVVDFVGAAQLQKWYRAATSAAEVEIDFPRNVSMPNEPGVEEAYIGYVDAESLLRLIELKGEDGEVVGVNRAIFVDNIRDYDPDSKINQAIRESVRTAGGSGFVFRNNGITVVAKGIDRTSDRFKLQDYQIVNGCQTSNVIFDLIHNEHSLPKEQRELLRKTIQVPFRLIGSSNDAFVSTIIIGTNRQNPVRDEQFWALRPFMKSLEEYCRNLENDQILFIERRENQFRGQAVEGTRIMQPATLMKAVAACLLFQPHRAGRDYRNILSDYENVMFLEGHDVRIYHAVGFLHSRLEYLWRNQRLEASAKVFRYYILSAIGIAITRTNSVFSMNARRASAVAQEIVALAADDEELARVASRVIVEMRSLLAGARANDRERNAAPERDIIRSETFANVFRQQIAASDLIRSAGSS